MTEEEEISERRKLLLPKLFRVWNTLIKMMKDRGYSLEERKEKLDYNEWLDEFQNKPISQIFYKVIKENPPHVKRIYFEYREPINSNGKINSKDIEIFYSNLQKALSESGVILISDILTSQAKQKIIDYNAEIQIQCFTLNELIVNITEHTYVPQHILLNEEEKSKLLSRYRIKEGQLPKILTTDPIAKYLGLRKGNVVKIIRDSETAGKYVTYRITV